MAAGDRLLAFKTPANDFISFTLAWDHAEPQVARCKGAAKPLMRVFHTMNLASAVYYTFMQQERVVTFSVSALTHAHTHTQLS